MIPSQKTLERAFPGKGKELRAILTSEEAVNAHPAVEELRRQCYHAPTMGQCRMAALNAALDGFGVEYVPHGHNARSPAFHYVNLGDAYTTTIVRFPGGRYRVTDWGSIVERGHYD